MDPLEKTGFSVVSVKKFYKHLLLAWWILVVLRIIYSTLQPSELYKTSRTV